jgi:putative ABC transport system substrate-binding protein
MRHLGWAERENLSVEWRFAEGRNELLPELAADLVHFPVEIIFAVGGLALVPAQQQTSVIPIVVAAGPDPTSPSTAGSMQSLARPGGNVTGSAYGNTTVGTKSVELLKAVLPHLTRLAFIADPTAPSYVDARPWAAQTAQTLGLQVLDLDVRSVHDVDRAFEAARLWNAEGLLVFANATFVAGVYALVVEQAARSRMPAMYQTLIPVTDDGGLMEFSANYFTLVREGAQYVDKILRGASPADLPVEEPRQYDFVVNVKAAQTLGITFPPDGASQVTQWIQ